MYMYCNQILIILINILQFVTVYSCKMLKVPCKPTKAYLHFIMYMLMYPSTVI